MKNNHLYLDKDSQCLDPGSPTPSGLAAEHGQEYGTPDDIGLLRPAEIGTQCALSPMHSQNSLAIKSLPHPPAGTLTQLAQAPAMPQWLLWPQKPKELERRRGQACEPL